jgi:hypothetical protein
MAKLHEYLNDNGFYIQHSFASKRRIHHVTYQVSSEAEAILQKSKIKDGEVIPDKLFNSLRNSGKIFTDRRGVEGIALPALPPDSYERQFQRLSHEARFWITERIEAHPSTKVENFSIGPNGEYDVEISGLPEKFAEQLMHIALMHNGTDFFKNLSLSYRPKISTQPRSNSHAQPPKKKHPDKQKNWRAKQQDFIDELQRRPNVAEAEGDGPAIIAVTLQNEPADAHSLALIFAQDYASAAGLSYAKCFLIHAGKIIGRGRHWTSSEANRPKPNPS